MDNNNEQEESSTEVPEEDAINFKRLFRLSANALAAYMVEANEYQLKLAEAKTKPKRDLYTKKFNKVRDKFQDELHRLNQLNHIMKENDISLDDDDEGLEFLKQFADSNNGEQEQE
tara:strand:+ start:237 stop:584 length:348 start_codon:yes stop_codon:yes gene_type:complete